jgi:hypothetical protein
LEKVFAKDAYTAYSVYGKSRFGLSVQRLNGGTMSKDKGLRPGQTAPKSGQYVQVGPRGGKGNEVTVTKGEPMPPAPKPGIPYDLTDPSKNMSGQGK